MLDLTAPVRVVSAGTCALFYKVTMSNAVETYPAAAYAADGTLWWKLKTYPGTKRKYGVEPKLMAWLAFNKQVGDVFTTKEVRAALGKNDIPNDDEHFQRRLRELRKDGWDIPSTKYDRNLNPEHYRIDAVGWHPGLGTARPARRRISDKLRREVLDRDGWRCRVCGVGSGEPYDDEPGTKAQLQAGHILSDEFGGAPTIDNLRAECSRCNEPVRSDLSKPESTDEIITAARSLKAAELRRLSEWVSAGMRVRDRVDVLYDRIRQLPNDAQDEARTAIVRMTRRS